MTTATILVGTWDDGLYAVNGNRRTQEIAGVSVRGLVVDGRGGALALVGGHTLRRRSAEGAWTTVATSDRELSCCRAVGEAIYVGTDDALMLRLSDGGALELLEGFDTVAGRDSWFAGSAIVNGQRLGPPLGVRSLAANADGSVLFANVHVGGIPRSRDGGRTWAPTIDILADVHEVCAHPTNPELVVAAAAVGLCISRDAGATWIVEREGLHAPHCAAVAFSGDSILFSASTDPFGAEGRIYRRSVEPEGAIERVEDGLPVWTQGSADTGCIAAKGSMVAVVDRGGSLYLSGEFGRGWSRSPCEVPGASLVLIC